MITAILKELKAGVIDSVDEACIYTVQITDQDSTTFNSNLYPVDVLPCCGQICTLVELSNS